MMFSRFSTAKKKNTASDNRHFCFRTFFCKENNYLLLFIVANLHFFCSRIIHSIDEYQQLIPSKSSV